MSRHMHIITWQFKLPSPRLPSADFCGQFKLQSLAKSLFSSAACLKQNGWFWQLQSWNWIFTNYFEGHLIQLFQSNWQKVKKKKHTVKNKMCFISMVSIRLVGRPTRWSLLFIFGFLIWSSRYISQIQSTEKYSIVLCYYQAGEVIMSNSSRCCDISKIPILSQFRGVG